ncbi:MAG: gluconokinase [Acidobacteria bacterium]|nr:gluconokinase [Acidobacteriota bacterium]
MPASTKQYILALDIGTSSVRAALYDDAGNVLPRTMVKNERTLTATDEGGAEIEAGEAFEQIVAAVDDVLEKATNVKGDITHVATSCFWHSLVGVDAKRKPTTKVFGWADTRSREQVAVLKKRFDESAVHSRTGARFHSSFWPAKLLWLKGGNTSSSECAPFKKTASWLSLSDYILLKLTDTLTTSVSMASATGIFDLRKCAWDAELLKFLKVKPSALPQIAVEDSATFALNSKFAKRWPRLKNSQWFPAIGDGAANNIGAGCVKKSKAALMIGTSGAMRVAYKGDPPATIPPGLWCYRVDRTRVIIGGALSDGGGLYRWLKDNLRLLADDDKTEAEIAKRPPAGHGLIFLPFLAGERSTGYHENATGAIIGLRSATDTIDIVQAALESVAYRFADILDQLNHVCRIREIVASGGALRQSPVWTQIIADVLGRNMSLPDTREASSRGAVLLALEIVGKIRSIERIPTPEGCSFKTDRARSGLYLAAKKNHSENYKCLMS